MKRYEKYIAIPSTVSPVMPEAWTAKKLKFILSYSKGKQPSQLTEEPIGDPYATMDYLRGRDCILQYPVSTEGLVYIDNDSLLVLWDGANAGEFLRGKAGYLGSTMAVVKAGDNMDKSYLFYLLKGSEALSKMIAGGTTIPHFSPIFFDEVFAIPSLDEQQKIAAFLDYKTGKIDRLTEMLAARIEDLKQYRQSVISEVVTRGLNNSVDMKDSGVVEIGNIPEHWSLSPIKYLLEGSMKYGANESAESDNRDWPRYIRITDITETGALRDGSFKSLSPDKANGYMLQKGDVLFARSGATVGKTYLFNEDYPACYAGYLIKATCGVKLLPEYLIRYTQSSSYDSWKNSVYILSTIQNIGADKYSNLPIPVPPIEEQMSIVEYLGRKTKQIDDTIAATEQQIKDLQVYRISLISEAVTGQIDVRDWTAPIE